MTDWKGNVTSIEGIKILVPDPYGGKYGGQDKEIVVDSKTLKDWEKANARREAKSERLTAMNDALARLRGAVPGIKGEVFTAREEYSLRLSHDQMMALLALIDDESERSALADVLGLET